jgi:hypothetical protein
MVQKEWKKSAHLASFETQIHEALAEEMVQARRQLLPACLVILWRSNTHNTADAASLISVLPKSTAATASRCGNDKIPPNSI